MGQRRLFTNVSDEDSNRLFEVRNIYPFFPHFGVWKSVIINGIVQVRGTFNHSKNTPFLCRPRSWEFGLVIQHVQYTGFSKLF